VLIGVICTGNIPWENGIMMDVRLVIVYSIIWHLFNTKLIGLLRNHQMGVGNVMTITQVWDIQNQLVTSGKYLFAKKDCY
jgi:hypothetical protein